MIRAAAVLLLAAATACAEAEPPPAATAASEPADSIPAPVFRGRLYERSFVFTTLDRDTAVLAPWIFRARTRPGRVERRTRGWLARSGSWEPVYDRSFETPPSPSPWRILPNQGVRIVVGLGDAVESVLFREGQRALDLELREPLTEWQASGREAFRLLEAGLRVGEERMEGMVLDMARAVAAEAPRPGGWAFLVSGDSLQLVLEAPEEGQPGTPAGHRGWARLDFRDLRWPEVEVAWDELRAFEPARRDIPVTWSFRSAGEEPLEGVLTARSAEIQAGDGDGPVLPVDAFFAVDGTVTIEGRDYPVQGVVRHTRR